MNDFNQKVVQQIVRLREWKKLSQKYLAQAINCSESAYSRLENCETEMTLNKLAAIAAVLGKDPSEFLESQIKDIINDTTKVVLGSCDQYTLSITISGKDIERLLARHSKSTA
jgi:transcriptional regulator with XRE-family HTH domain